MMIGIQSLLHDIAGLRKHEDDIAGRSIEKLGIHMLYGTIFLERIIQFAQNMRYLLAG